MGVNANFGILQPVDVGGQVTQAFQHGRQERDKQTVRAAMRQLSQNPQDETAMNDLLAVAPDLAYKFQDRTRLNQQYERRQKFDAAAGDYYRSQRPMGLADYSNAPAPSTPMVGLGGNSPTFTPPAATPRALPPIAQSGDMGDDGITVPQPEGQSQAALSPRDKAFYRMMEIDPVKAMKIDSEARNQAIERLNIVDDAYDLAIGRLSSVNDEASYQSVLREFTSRLAPLDIDISSMVPPNYPGPDGVRQLLQSALDAKEQLAALDRRDRLNQDIADDEADNARADRNTGNMIDVRNRRVGITEARESRIASKPKGRGGGKPKRKAKAGQPTARDAKGRRVAWDGKGWKPVQ